MQTQLAIFITGERQGSETELKPSIQMLNKPITIYSCGKSEEQ